MKILNKMFVFALMAVLVSLTFTGFVSAITLPPQIVIGASPMATTSPQSTIAVIGVDLSDSGIDYVRIYENGIMVKECRTSVCVYVAVHLVPGVRAYHATTADNNGGTAISTTINVDFQNTPPVLNPIGNLVVNNDALLAFTISGYDYNGDALTYSATGLPAGATFNPVTQTFSWTPNSFQVGSYFVTFLVSDGSLSDSEVVQIEVIGLPIVDTTLPLVEFVSPTDASGSTINRNYILANVTASDLNLVNITINLYNSTGLINSTTSTSSPLFLNFAGLSDGVYYFNATAYDLAGNFNSTETRNVTVDTSVIPGEDDEGEEDEDGGARIKTVGTNELTNGYYVYLGVDDKLKFIFCGSPYYIKLTDIDSDDDNADFILTPGNSGFVLREEESENIDLDLDDLNDILFRLESVSTSKAKVYIKRTSDMCVGVTSDGADVYGVLNFEKLLPKEREYNLGPVAGFLITGILLCVFGILIRSAGRFRRR